MDREALNRLSSVCFADTRGALVSTVPAADWQFAESGDRGRLSDHFETTF